MADTALRIVQPTLTGQTGLTLSVFALDGDTVLNSGGDTLTETAQANGVFTATVTESLDGLYRYTISDGANLVHHGTIVLADTAGPFVADSIAAIIERPGGMVDGIRSVMAGITRLSSWLRALARKDAADAIAMGEINTGGGTYDPTESSLAAATVSRGAILTATTPSATNGIRHTLTIEVKTGAPRVGVGGALVQLRGTTVNRYTNDRGEVEIPLPDGSYEFVIVAPGIYDSTPIQTIEIDGEDKTHEVVVTAQAIPEGTDPTMGTVHARFRLPNGTPIVGGKLIARLPTRYAGSGVGTERLLLANTRMETLTDANGEAALVLVPTTPGTNIYGDRFDDSTFYPVLYEVELWHNEEVAWRRTDVSVSPGAQTLV